MPADLYTTILDIPPGERPPDLYELLGVELFESDGAAIHRAGLRQMRRLKDWELHPDPPTREMVQELLNDVGGALSILESPARREEYDRNLAESRGLNLARDTGYEQLKAVPLTRECPNCGAAISDLANQCIECGYDHRLGRVVQTAGKALGAAIELLPTVVSRTGYVSRKCPECEAPVELADDTCQGCGHHLRRRPRLRERRLDPGVARTRAPSGPPPPPGSAAQGGQTWGVGLVGVGRTGAASPPRGRTTRGCLVPLLVLLSPVAGVLVVMAVRSLS